MATAFHKRVVGSIILLFLLFVSSVASVPVVSAHQSSSSVVNDACLQPPSDTDLSILTDSQLSLYGLPPRPKDVKHQAQWKQHLQHAKHRVCNTTDYQPTLYASPLLDLGPTYTPNWTGYLGGKMYPFISYQVVEAYWNVPCLASDSPLGSSLVWVGLGGAPGTLLQTGTVQEKFFAPTPGGSFHTRYWAFVENTSNSSNSGARFAFSVACGDYMWAYADNYGDLLIWDLTSGVYSWQTITPLPDTSTAECIAEAPLDAQLHQKPLANFQSVYFQRCDVETNDNSTLHPIGQEAYNEVYTFNNLMSLGPLNSGDYFTVTWLRAQ